MSCPMCGSMHGGPCADMITKQNYPNLDEIIAIAGQLYPYTETAGVASPSRHARHLTIAVQQILMRLYAIEKS